MRLEIGQCLKFVNHFRFFANYFSSGHGFQLEYQSTIVPSQWVYRMGEPGECGGLFTFPFGSVTSPSYPDNYPDNADCIYTISQPTGNVILLKFITMYIEKKQYGTSSCIYDYLEIRDGSSADCPLLDKLCGGEMPSSIQSSQNQLWMR